MNDDAKHHGQDATHGPAGPGFHQGLPAGQPGPGDGPEAATEQSIPAAEAPADQLTLMEQRIQELEAQQTDLTGRLLRAHADMDNLRKRTEKEKSDSLKYAVSKFALDIVGVSDNFQRAVAAVPHHATEHDMTLKALVEGVVMTERAFQQVLERHGVTRLDPTGRPFDPNQHQAVVEQQNPDVPSGTVLQVFQVGYMLQDRVLRPAMVSVARGGIKPSRPEANAVNGGIGNASDGGVGGGMGDASGSNDRQTDSAGGSQGPHD